MLPDIEFRSDEAWQPLPQWARYVWDLGERLAERGEDGKRINVALSVPSRAFVSSIAAAAYLSVRAGRDQLATPDLIAPGTDILLMHGSKGRIGRVDGPGEMTIQGMTVRGLRVRLEGPHNAAQLVVFKPGLRLARAPRAFDPSRCNGAGAHLTAVKVPRKTPFSEVLLHGDPHTYNTSTVLDCVLIGPRALIRSELVGQLFRVRDTGTHGVLGEIVRAAELVGTSNPSHSRIVSEFAPRVAPELLKPSLVVFDGATGFRKWRHLLRAADWLVVLDRSRPDYAEAVHLMEEEYGRRDGEASFAVATPPGGMDLTVFMARR